MIRSKIIALHAILVFFLVSFTAQGADPTATRYDAAQCAGSSMPYPTPDLLLRAVPDSLTPVYLSHVGRHGARFLSSSKYTTLLLRHLQKADSLKTITPKGRALLKATKAIVAITDKRWGALDSLGMAEQRAIASRTYAVFPTLFDGTRISAISSYVPRCIASMDEFTHQLSRLNNKIEIYTSSGRQNNALMRPWTDDEEYRTFIDGEGWRAEYDKYTEATMPANIAAIFLGQSYPLEQGEAADIALTIYKVVSGSQAMGRGAVNPAEFLSPESYNALWGIENMHHYLTHSASTLSRAPMDLAAALLNEIVKGLDAAASGTNPNSAELRFGHAETLMPLLALIRLKGCYYITNYFDTVGLHWKDFQVVPMAANLQLELFKAKSGRLYLRAELNEVPVPLIPGQPSIYVEWNAARDYLLRCLPLYLQP